MVKTGRGDELFTSKFPFPLLITAAGYIDKYGPAERYNILKFAADLPCPALFTYGSKELASGGIAFAGLPEALMALPNADRRSVAVIEGADHVYTGVADDWRHDCDWLAVALSRYRCRVLGTESEAAAMSASQAPPRSPAVAGDSTSGRERRSSRR